MKHGIRILVILILSFPFYSYSRKIDYPSAESLKHECIEALAKRDYLSMRKWAEQLYSQSSSDSTGVDHGYANFFLGTAEIFIGDSKKGHKCLEKAKDIGEACGNDSLTGKALNCLGIYEANVNSNYYLAQHYLLRSLDYPGNKGSVYSNLAQIARLQKDTAGMEYARMCYKYGIENNDPYFTYSGLISIAEFQILKKEYHKAEETLRKARTTADKGQYEDRIRLDFLHAVILSHLNETQQSNEILISLHDTVMEKTPIYLAELQFVIGKNYEKQKDYKKANEWLRKAVESCEKYASYDYTVMIYRQLAENHNMIGDYTGALKYMTLAYDIQKR